MDGGVIRYSCPQTCDYCEKPFEAASPSQPAEPSSQPTILCQDDDNLYYPWTDVPFCKWVRRKENRRVQWCKKSSVNESCPYACGVCCQDDPSYAFVNNYGVEKDCAWIGERSTRRDEYCDQYKGGSMVRYSCPNTCEYCEEYVSVAPSPA